MEFLSEIGQVSDVSEINSKENSTFSKETLEKYDKIMGDDNLNAVETETLCLLDDEEIESKYNKLFDDGDFFDQSIIEKLIGSLEQYDDNIGESQYKTMEETDLSQKQEPNSEYELNGDVYETDDNGDTYKKNGEMMPDIEYSVNENKYKTDEYGNIISCDSEPSYTAEGTRNIKEQREAGGDERLENDDGGHIIAKVLGGAEGEENLVPMRRTINRGDYKKMENEISNALQDGEDVSIHVDLEYEGDSKRPSIIRSEYNIDNKRTITEFDNNENSTELLDSLDGKINDEDFNELKEEIEDMRADGIEATITSVKVEEGQDGNPLKITVGVLDESTGIKSYKVYEPK